MQSELDEALTSHPKGRLVAMGVPLLVSGHHLLVLWYNLVAFPPLSPGRAGGPSGLP